MVGSAYEFEIPECAAVTAIGEGLAGDVRADDVGALFRRVHRALRAGGPFIFDVVERSPQDRCSIARALAVVTGA